VSETKKVNRRKWQIAMRTSNSHIAAGAGNRMAGQYPDREVRVRYDQDTQLCHVEWRKAL
jgi:hypothetical protein